MSNNPHGRPKYYTEPMVKKTLLFPRGMWERMTIKAAELSERSGRRITASDLLRKGAERLLKEI